MFELTKRDDTIVVEYVGEISRYQRQFNTISIKIILEEIMSKVDKAIKEKRSNVSIVLKNTAQLFNIYDDIIRNRY